MPDRTRRPTSTPNRSTASIHGGPRSLAQARATTGEARIERRPVSQPVLRAQPTAETEEAMRTVGQNLASLIAEAEAEQARRLREAEERAAAATAEAESAASTHAELESMVEELLARVEAAEQRATRAEQQAIYAGQQAAQAAEQLMQGAEGAAAPAQPLAAVAREAVADVPARGSSVAVWAGWGVAVLALAAVAAGYFASYRPLRDQLVAQTKLAEDQANRHRESEAALRASFESERETLNRAIDEARAAATAAAASAALVTADAESAAAEKSGTASDDEDEDRAAAKAARAAKREARLAKKAERAAKREARLAAKKDKARERESSSPLPAASSRDTSADDLGSDDPLEGL